MTTGVGEETYSFQSDINQLLSLIINTFYSKKEVCVRELISNASDAIDKYRFKKLSSGVSADPDSFQITITPNALEKTLTISDTGIGMTKQDLITCLGTIAKSGTKEFVEKLLSNKQDTSVTDIAQIGQFGVGFYSAYLIADKVTVVTKHDDDCQYTWQSNANGSFTIVPNTIPDMERGTRVIMHLKDDQVNFLNTDYLRELVCTHNQFVQFPIMLQVEQQPDNKVNENDDENDDHCHHDNEVEGVVDDVDEQKSKAHEDVTVSLERINKQKPIWLKAPSDVSPLEYESFYKTITKDYDAHLAVKHFGIEGSVDMKCILYIPKHAPFDLYESEQKLNNIKLYVKRVFITDDSEELIPRYLCFIKGIVDSEDLPLNISREVLQHSKLIKVVKKNIVKKSIEMMQEMASEKPSDYKLFYEQFSRFIKLGIYEDSVNMEKLQQLLMYNTSKSMEDQKTLASYVENMKDNQKGIYYISGESNVSLKNSPLVDYLTDNGYEVIFMTEALDEYVMQKMSEYKGKKFICVSKNTDLVDKSDQEKVSFDSKKEYYTPFCKYVKEILHSLGRTDVVSVDISDRLSKKTPCIVTTETYGWTANMERILKAQSQKIHGMGTSRKVVLINAEHPIIAELVKQHENDCKSVNKDLIQLVFDMSLMSSGFSVPDPSQLSQTMYRLIAVGLNLTSDDVDDDGDGDDGDNCKEKDLPDAEQNMNGLESLD